MTKLKFERVKEIGFDEDSLLYNTIEIAKLAIEYYDKNELWYNSKEIIEIIEPITLLHKLVKSGKIKLNQKDIDLFPIGWYYDSERYISPLVQYWAERILKRKQIQKTKTTKELKISSNGMRMYIGKSFFDRDSNIHDMLSWLYLQKTWSDYMGLINYLKTKNQYHKYYPDSYRISANRLVRLKLAIKRINPKDKRKNEYKITKKGEKVWMIFGNSYSF